ncbi:MAG TPA: phosphate ABC transporter substrate-binding protein PstS [Roseomonas sp.]
MARRFLSTILVLAAALLAPDSAQSQGFSGAGSTFAHPVLARWGQVFSTLQGEGGGVFAADGGFDYEPVGSLAGVLRVIQGAVEFGATDVPLAPEELARHELIQFPIVTGGIAVVANLRGVASERLRLSGAVLARIYLGGITRWSDPAIRALNPDVTLPDAPIAVIRREDGSGTTYNFAAYLAGASPDWRQQVGVDTQLRWPAGVGARSNGGLADLVQATENAIGFVDASQVARLAMKVVLVENRAGRFVAPNAQSLQAAMATTAWDPARHFHQPLAAPGGEDAYPITATVFALMQRRPASRSRARMTQDFFRLALTERAADATALGYVPLPEAVARQVTAYWSTAATAAR